MTSTRLPKSVRQSAMAILRFIRRKSNHFRDRVGNTTTSTPFVARSTRAITRPNRQLLDKIAFVIHMSDMYHHYEPIWHHMDRSKIVVIVATSDVSERNVCIAQAKRCGIDARTISDVHSEKDMYRVAVSNHPLMARSLLPNVGFYHVRYLYALGKAKHNTAPWNRYYDEFLGFGPWHEKALSPFPGKTHSVGYARYDKWFTNRLSRHAALQTLSIPDHGKPTLAWLPTWGDLCSIPWHIKEIRRIAKDWTILVKPHPLIAKKQPDLYSQLVAARELYSVPDSVDSMVLFAAADIVAADYGGSPFGAIYLDKPLLLFDVPSATSCELMSVDSPDVCIRKHIWSAAPGTSATRLIRKLEDDAYWNKQAGTREQLRAEYFAPNYGRAAKVAAELLESAWDRIHAVHCSTGQHATPT